MPASEAGAGGTVVTPTEGGHTLMRGLCKGGDSWAVL